MIDPAADICEKEPDNSPVLQYEAWLPEWSQLVASAPSTPCVPVDAAHISTPLILSHWHQALELYPYRELADFFLQGVSQGFRIGFAHGSVLLKSAKQNLEGARSHPKVVEEYLQTEVNLTRVAGPFLPCALPVCQISRFGVIPKNLQPEKWRLIVDLSYPKGNSVNDGIPKRLCSIKYITIEDAIQHILSLGPGTLIAKIDIKSAFRLLPIHPGDRHLLGMKWNNEVYLDTCLPFGLRSAPRLFNVLADLLEWILQQKGVTFSLHYLDDFLTAGPPRSDICQKNLEAIQQVCHWLGIPLALEKVEGPSTSLGFLGITLDTVRMEARLPADKLQRTRALIKTWMQKKKATKREILSLVGVLQHATKVVKCGRTFLSRMYTTAAKLRELHFYTRLDKGFRSDLGWWDVFLVTWNGISLLQCACSPLTSNYDHSIQTDASGSWGCGAFLEGRWLQMQWTPEWIPVNIMAKELLPILLSCAVWGPQLARKKILIQCDNSSVVAALKKGSAHDDTVMHLLRCLWFFVAHYNMVLLPEHIAGSDNCTADLLSRNNLHNFFSINPQASPVPAPVPLPLWRLLAPPGLDWTSATFRQLFLTIINEA